jgi:hypothetical protein
MHIGDICYVGNIWFGIILDCNVIFAGCNFCKSSFYCRYNAGFSFGTNKNLTFLRLFFANLVSYFCRNMSTGSPQRRVRQRTEGDLAALRTKIMDRPVIAERNVVRANIMVAPLDSIHYIIQTYHWGYLYNCACVVLTQLARLFYANLEVVQNDDNGIVLQSTIDGHSIMVDPQVISQIIKVPVLQLLANPYNEVVLPLSLNDLKEFFQAVPQGEKHATTIKIGALSASHRILSKIILHNIWPVTRHSDLILKKVQSLDENSEPHQQADSDEV